MIVDTNENKFVELISNIPNVAVQGYDKDRKVIYWNKASENIYGYTKEEALGKKLEDLIIPDFMRDDVISFITNWYENGEAIPSSELPLQHKNGSTVYVYSSHVMLGENTDNPEMFCVDIDRTKQKEQEEILKKQDLLLIQQSKMAQMGEMISMIAHQWRQPLSAISMTSANLQMKMELESFDLEKADDRDECIESFNNGLEDINRFVQNLSATIDDFRNFYKQNKKTVEIRLEEVMKKSLNIIKASLINDNIKIIEEYNSYKAIELYSNEIMQVVLNLLKNAQDNFREKDIKNPTITITTDAKTISICDNGGGISKDIIEKIFDPYFSTKSEKNGTGLGLYMSKTIVEEHHGGLLSVKNRDEGVCFIIDLNGKTLKHQVQ